MNIEKLLKYLDFLVVIKIEKHFYRNNLCKEMLVSYTSWQTVRKCLQLGIMGERERKKCDKDKGEFF